MEDNLVIYGLLGTVGLMIAGFLVYYLAMHMKGKITLTAPDKWLEPGEPFKGNIKLEAKKAIHAQAITATLQCDMQVQERYRNHKGESNTRTHTITLHQNMVVLSDQRTIPAGQFQYFDFSFTIPESLPHQDDMLRDLASKHLGTIGEALVDLSQFSNRKRISWELSIHVDAQGIDLRKSKRLKVNLKPDNTVFD